MGRVLTEFFACIIQTSADVSETNRSAHSHGIYLFVNRYGVEGTEVDLDTILD